jgi:hypothetical protein
LFYGKCHAVNTVHSLIHFHETLEAYKLLVIITHLIKGP